MDKLDLIYDLTKQNEAKLAKIHEDVTLISKETTINTANLAEHMRRTELAESRIDKNSEKLDKIESRFTFAWLTKMMATIVAFLGSLGAIVGYLKGWF